MCVLPGPNCKSSPHKSSSLETCLQSRMDSECCQTLAFAHRAAGERARALYAVLQPK
jgi:hypothetical protein